MNERATSAFDKKIGERVRARRLELGMSQERLAEVLGVTFQQVQKYEKGVNRVAASRLFDISQSLDTPITYFFFGAQTGAGKGKERSDERVADPEAIKLLGHFSAIKNKNVRKRVVEIIRAMSEDGGE